MTVNTDHHRLIADLQQRAAGYRITLGAPLVKFRHETGSLLLTRNAVLYRRTAGWVELPFDTSSPVPRRPG